MRGTTHLCKVAASTSTESDFASLLRRHKLSSFDLGIPQVITTERPGQGDWGLKRALPRSRVKEVIVDSLDSRERQTVFRSGAGHARFIERMQHLSPRLNTNQSIENHKYYFDKDGISGEVITRPATWSSRGINSGETTENTSTVSKETEQIEDVVRVYQQEIEKLSMSKFRSLQNAIAEWRKIHRIQPDLFPISSLHNVFHHFVHLSPVAGGLIYSSPIAGSNHQNGQAPDPVPAHVFNGTRSHRTDGSKAIAVGIGGLVAHCQIKDSALSRMIDRRLESAAIARESGGTDYSAIFSDRQARRENASTLTDPEGKIPTRTTEVYSLDRLWVQPLSMTISKEGQLYLSVEAVPARAQVAAESRLYEQKGQPLPTWIVEYNKIQERQDQDRLSISQFSQARQARLQEQLSSGNLEDIANMPISSTLRRRLSEQVFRRNQARNPYLSRFQQERSKDAEGDDASGQSRLVEGIRKLSEREEQS